MAGGSDIFQRARLSPSQARTIAQRRYDDADFLCGSGRNAHANGAMYLGGFAVECLLKARLMGKYPEVERAPSPDSLPEAVRAVWYLAFKSHDIEEMLVHLPEISARFFRELPDSQARRLDSSLKRLAYWSIQARYSPKMATNREARDFLDRIKELKSWLL